jgi:phosphohistidine phosphatase
MKTLLLLRHAKSSWAKRGVHDHDRPLNARGKRDAPRIGRLLREQQLTPDAIFSSTAKRARKTAQKVAQGSGFSGKIQLLRELYLADTAALLTVMRDLNDEFQRPLLVGHNPGFEEFLAALTGQDEHLPTAGLAQITVPLDRWGDATEETRGELTQLWRPKELEE